MIHREHVPVDASAIAFVGGNAVHEQQHAGTQALHVAARAADVDLAVQELHAGRLVHRFIHRGHRAARDLRVGHERYARDDLIEELGAFPGRHDHGLAGSSDTCNSNEARLGVLSEETQV